MIKTVTLLPCKKKNVLPDSIKATIRFILHDCDKILMDAEFAPMLEGCFDSLEFACGDEVFSSSDLVVVMGGDGSIIDAARRAAGFGIPVVGINYGRLGFLSELDDVDIASFFDILKGKFQVEERMMLEVTIERDGSQISLPYPALNEVVLSNGPRSRLSSFELCCDGTQIARYSADGIIISTPTGSSAYSMSAGGPLIYQTMECICATPVCPHSFTLRPVVFPGESVIEIKNALCRENSMYITVDGKEHIEVFSGDVIRIKKNAFSAKFARIKEGGFVSVLNRKLSEIDDLSL